MSAQDEIWLTQDAYDRLQAELAERSGPIRAEIAQKIGAAREEGDLKENGGYHAAREEQGKNEARVRQLLAAVPELPDARRGRLAARYGLGDDDAAFLAGSAALSSFFEQTAANSAGVM